jgi:hypothetical protein
MNDLWAKFVNEWLHTTPSNSPLGELNGIDWMQVAVNTTKVALAGAATAGLSYFSKEVLSVDWGQLTVLAVPLVHFALDYVTKLLTDNTQTPQV